MVIKMETKGEFKYKMGKCDTCGKEVPEYDLDRDGDCCQCRAENRMKEMVVGDLNVK